MAEDDVVYPEQEAAPVPDLVYPESPQPVSEEEDVVYPEQAEEPGILDRAGAFLSNYAKAGSSAVGRIAGAAGRGVAEGIDVPTPIGPAEEEVQRI